MWVGSVRVKTSQRTTKQFILHLCTDLYNHTKHKHASHLKGTFAVAFDDVDVADQVLSCAVRHHLFGKVGGLHTDVCKETGVHPNNLGGH